MVAIRLSLDDLYLVINPFDFASVDLVITVVQDTVATALQHLCKAIN